MNQNLCQPNKCSELLMAEQLVSECNKQLKGECVSYLTLDQYEKMCPDEKKPNSKQSQAMVFKGKRFTPQRSWDFLPCCFTPVKKCTPLLQNGQAIRYAETFS